MEINGSLSVDSDHHFTKRNSTGKPMQSNDSSGNSPSHCGINGRRHSSVIPALPKINRNSNVPSPNYLRASTGSCHDFCKFGRKTKSEEELRPWRSIRKQSNSSTVVAPSPKVDIFLLKQSDTLLNEDDAPEKGKSCEKIKMLQPTVVAKPKSNPVVAVISGEMDASIKKGNKMMVSKPKILKAVVRKNTERVESCCLPVVDIERSSNRKTVIKIGKSLDVSNQEKSSPPAVAAAAVATISKKEKTPFPSASKKEKSSSPAAATISKKGKSSFPAAATSKKEKSSPSLSAAVSKPIKSVSTNRLVKTNSSRKQSIILKKRMVGIHEDSNSLEKTVIKQIEDESGITPAADSNENEERIHEESNNENSQQKMEIVVESENPYAIESNENEDTIEVEKSSEDDNDDETEEEEEEEEEETNKLAEDGVKLKFRRGRVIDIQAEGSNSPRRLRFRRGRIENSAQGISVHVKRHNFRKKATIIPSNNVDPDSEIIMLRHQDIEEKKDAQGLFNNVIEETATKLVLEARKSKVKALVGAFETVISLQDTTTKHPSPQTLLS